MENTKIARSFGTHDGSFHADEVTACALLLLFKLIDRDKIVRTRNSELLFSCEYICDVGGLYDSRKKMFDHHQVEYKGSLSSAGMVLLYLKEQGYLDPLTYDFFNRSLIMGVDAHDNGFEPQVVGFCSFSNVITNYNPIEYQSSKAFQDSCFFQALDFVFNHVERLLTRYNYMQSCREIVAEQMKKQESVLLFEQGVPWLDIFFELNGRNHPALFVVMPSSGHWKLRAIPPSLEERMQVRKPLPEAWAGLHDEDLKKVSGIEGAIFCHKGRFISVWKTREDALKALNYVLEG